MLRKLMLFFAFTVSTCVQGVEPADTIWTACGSPQRFIQQDLFNHIDGGADLFLEFGFDTLMVQSYCQGEAEIAVELYRMESPAAALGIYLMKRDPKNEVWDEFRYSANALQLTAVKGPFFCLVNNFTNGAALQAAMLELLKRTFSAVSGKDSLQIFALLPVEQLAVGSERLIRGPYALQSLYTLGPDDILQLNGRLFAVAGDYQRPDGTVATLVMVDYGSAERCAAAWIHLRQHLDPYLQVIREEPNRFVFKDYEDKYGQVWMKGNVLQVLVHLAE
jgi:hypothetical protein